MPVTGYVVGFMEYWSIGVLEKNRIQTGRLKTIRLLVKDKKIKGGR